jgi:hypothetical protein
VTTVPISTFTEDEIEYDFFKKARCVYCKSGEDLLIGPSGAISQNLECANCGTRYNHHLMGAVEVLAGPKPTEYWGTMRHLEEYRRSIVARALYKGPFENIIRKKWTLAITTIIVILVMILADRYI